MISTIITVSTKTSTNNNVYVHSTSITLHAPIVPCPILRSPKAMHLDPTNTNATAPLFAFIKLISE